MFADAFTALDGITVLTNPTVSFLDLFLALAFFGITIDFIKSFMDGKSGRKSDDDNEGSKLGGES
jgi:hypothetical protein